MRLSKHFIDNWKERVGSEPTVEMVQDIMREGVAVQRFRTLSLQDGDVFRVLGIYWHPGLNIIITIDELTGIAVSVFSEKIKNWRLCLVKAK